MVSFSYNFNWTFIVLEANRGTGERSSTIDRVLEDFFYLALKITEDVEAGWS